jgi:transposase-like protein
MKYKKWTLKEKLEILSTSEEIGVVETCRKYSVSTGTFYSWSIYRSVAPLGDQVQRIAAPHSR